MKKLLLVTTLALALMMTLAPASFAADKELLIGALYPRSGPLALLGEESWRGAEIARMVRNESGGIDGKKIVFANGDCSDVAAARSEAERLIEKDDVGLIIGSYSSSRSMAATEVAARKGIPYFELGAIANAITKRGYSTVYRTNSTAAMFSKSQVGFIVDYIAPAIGKKAKDIKVSVAHEDSDYGTSVAASFKGLAEKAGLQVVSIEPYASSSSDLSPVVFRLKKADPDVIVLVCYANDAILLGRQAAEFKLNKPFIATGGGHSLQSFAKALGKNSDGIFNVDFTQYDVNTKFTPGLTKFLELYRKTFKEEPRSGHSLTNFMGANVVFDIIQKAGGTLNPEKIRKAAMSVDIPLGKTANGWGVKFDENGQNVRAAAFVSQWRGGKLLTVYPLGAAVTEAVLPNKK
ncbi:MAG: ABC transporter substrate-binding protein [Desulfarculaceae bacterium]|nr:ABC transporter substrate-binding protein [Desulfarculaceae bacterium]MCF8045959.1 ABC transporter substrate-binding protein [Desulfarculaceae bacterium]MCF8063688.1 ABC transporter substrate-binding protein [Desulfarculaceae bacterium]MCF8097593.1 ABC transporter substrate-binding protein [Desulfarculaceae bacterium]MCF8121162.1 ABC transporter substrate-binding protein [Desulfarculaceae bacterium]